MTPSSTIKTLVADDIDVMRGTLRALLGKYGFNDIAEASNGEDALKKLTLGQYHLLLLDIDMPKINGMDVLKKVRSHNKSIYIIMVSAHSSVENVKQAMKEGVNAFVVKPYTAKKIEAVINKFASEQNIALAKEG